MFNSYNELEEKVLLVFQEITSNEEIALSFTFTKKSKPPQPSTQVVGLLDHVLFAFEANYDVAKDCWC